MGIITDELREKHLEYRAQRCNDEQENLNGEDRERFRKVKGRLQFYVDTLRGSAENAYVRSGVVESVSLSFHQSADEMVLLKSPQILFEIEKMLREVEPKTVKVFAQRCRYERATRHGPDTRPTMMLIARFSPALT